MFSKQLFEYILYYIVCESNICLVIHTNIIMFFNNFQILNKKQRVRAERHVTGHGSPVPDADGLYLVKFILSSEVLSITHFVHPSNNQLFPPLHHYLRSYSKLKIHIFIYLENLHNLIHLIYFLCSAEVSCDFILLAGRFV